MLFSWLGNARAFAERWRRWLRLVPTVAALGLYAQASHRLILSTSFVIEGQRYYSLFDDGMISMRYAWNLVHRDGLVWNAGERIEGFTNPLWTLVMAAAIAVFSKTGAVLAMQVLGAILLGVTGAIHGRIASGLVGPAHWSVAAILEGIVVLTVTGIFPLRFWTHMGMEVSALLLLGALAWWLALVSQLRHRSLFIGLLMAIAYAVRPDGFIVVAPSLALCLYVTRASPRLIAVTSAPLFGTVVAFTLWRVLYYGSWVPNTYRLKMGLFPLGFRIKNGIGFVTPYLEQTLRLWVTALAVVLKRRDARAIALLASPIALLAYQVYVGGDPWEEWRQLAPGYPVLVLLSVLAASELVLLIHAGAQRAGTALGLGTRLVRRPAIVLALGIAAAVLVPLGARLLLLFDLRPTTRAFAKRGGLHFNVDWNKANVERGLLLQRVLGKDGRMAVFWGGATPYYDTEHYAIDILGKCDAHVAALPPDLSGADSWAGMKSVPGHNKSDLEYSVQGLNADYTEIFDWGSDRLSDATKGRFARHSLHGQGFQLRKGSPRINWRFVTSEEEAKP